MCGGVYCAVGRGSQRSAGPQLGLGIDLYGSTVHCLVFAPRTLHPHKQRHNRDTILRVRLSLGMDRAGYDRMRYTSDGSEYHHHSGHYKHGHRRERVGKDFCSLI